MEERICPTCGCLIASEGYETGGVVFCCEDCANAEEGKNEKEPPKKV
jgi:hypothetical protein